MTWIASLTGERTLTKRDPPSIGRPRCWEPRHVAGEQALPAAVGVHNKEPEPETEVVVAACPHERDPRGIGRPTGKRATRKWRTTVRFRCPPPSALMTKIFVARVVPAAPYEHGLVKAISVPSGDSAGARLPVGLRHEGQPSLVAAVDVHDVDQKVAVPIADERDLGRPRSLRRPRAGSRERFGQAVPGGGGLDSAADSSTESPPTRARRFPNTVSHAIGTPQYQCEPDCQPMTISGRATSQQMLPRTRLTSVQPVYDEVEKRALQENHEPGKPQHDRTAEDAGASDPSCPIRS